ncbi:MAG: DUF2892 domain-containing protein [Planctomycetota bacterium]|nr:MAG: DUF2892 domain-containing protein [Planctomycetota bacterium]
MRSMQPKEVYEKIQRGEEVVIIDVRTPVEFREVHIVGARNMPLDQLDAEALKAEGLGTAEKPLYVVCRSGNRSSKACDKLLAAGLENIINIDGGTLAWDAAGLPVKRGKKAISLERQVRIAAGFLVLSGVVLGYLVHPGFFLLSGFVGAGLMFAGITDTCAMGMLLAKMPWNRVSGCDASGKSSPAAGGAQGSQCST